MSKGGFPYCIAELLRCQSYTVHTLSVGRYSKLDDSGWWKEQKVLTQTSLVYIATSRAVVLNLFEL